MNHQININHPCMYQEEWEQLEHYPSYEVSSFGQVRNKITGRILKQKTSFGFHKVTLYDYKRRKTSEFVHELVGETFIERYGSKGKTSCIQHINDDKTNNKISNIQWF